MSSATLAKWSSDNEVMTYAEPPVITNIIRRPVTAYSAALPHREASFPPLLSLARFARFGRVCPVTLISASR